MASSHLLLLLVGAVCVSCYPASLRTSHHRNNHRNSIRNNIRNNLRRNSYLRNHLPNSLSHNSLNHLGNSYPHKRSHMLLVTQPWLHGPNLQYRRARGPEGALRDTPGPRPTPPPPQLNPGPAALMRTSSSSVASPSTASSPHSSPSSRPRKESVAASECQAVCHACKHLVSIRISALCPVECRVGGHSFQVCKIVWEFANLETTGH